MARSKTSKRWLKEHFEDPFVKKAQADGFRSRAVYKLIEIDDKDAILKQGFTVVDLGASPGGWSQVAAEKVGMSGRIVALDMLPMDSLAGVEFVQGDFTEEDVFHRLMSIINNERVDVVISDMAPNMSGNPAVDIPRAMYLVELSLEFAQSVLKPGGTFLAKVFQGSGFDVLLQQTRNNFSKVVIRKPQASRARSREIYLLAKGYGL
jgi:23S rRNA (uridine2552-2'-O)-methyltransferase